MRLDLNTKLEELCDDSKFKDIFPYLVYSSEVLGGGLKLEMSLMDIQTVQPTWDAGDMLYGLHRIEAILTEGKPFLYDVNENVKLLYFPSESKEFVILASGGAYGSVCNLPEAFPVAAKLNELGITAFCLNYRVGGPGLFPKPMEDMAAACKYIEAHALEFGVDVNKYAVGGFSAGGHLAAIWGTRESGYAKYACTKPEMLMLDYPMTKLWDSISRMPEMWQKMMFTGILGEDYSKEKAAPFEVVDLITDDYPASYIVQAKDDPTVPVINTEELVTKFDMVGVKNCYEQIETGLHGFGLGSKTKSVGWVERAVEFWREL